MVFVLCKSTPFDISLISLAFISGIMQSIHSGLYIRFSPLYDCLKRCPRQEYLLDASLLKFRNIFSGDNASTNNSLFRQLPFLVIVSPPHWKDAYEHQKDSR